MRIQITFGYALALDEYLKIVKWLCGFDSRKSFQKGTNKYLLIISEHRAITINLHYGVSLINNLLFFQFSFFSVFYFILIPGNDNNYCFYYYYYDYVILHCSRHWMHRICQKPWDKTKSQTSVIWWEFVVVFFFVSFFIISLLLACRCAAHANRCDFWIWKSIANVEYKKWNMKSFINNHHFVKAALFDLQIDITYSKQLLLVAGCIARNWSLMLTIRTMNDW